MYRIKCARSLIIIYYNCKEIKNKAIQISYILIKGNIPTQLCHDFFLGNANDLSNIFKSIRNKHFPAYITNKQCISGEQPYKWIRVSPPRPTWSPAQGHENDTSPNKILCSKIILHPSHCWNMRQNSNFEQRISSSQSPPPTQTLTHSSPSHTHIKEFRK